MLKCTASRMHKALPVTVLGYTFSQLVYSACAKQYGSDVLRYLRGCCMLRHCAFSCCSAEFACPHPFHAAAAASTAGGDDKEDTLADIKRRKRLERDPLHQGLIVQRAHLKSRDYQIDLSSRLGKTQVVGLNAPLSQQAGYYCNICDCVLRDSASYLDHINGKWHNRALGLSMRVEKSTVDQVKQRLEAHKKKAQVGRMSCCLTDMFCIPRFLHVPRIILHRMVIPASLERYFAVSSRCSLCSGAVFAGSSSGGLPT